LLGPGAADVSHASLNIVAGCCPRFGLTSVAYQWQAGYSLDAESLAAQPFTLPLKGNSRATQGPLKSTQGPFKSTQGLEISDCIPHVNCNSDVKLVLLPQEELRLDRHLMQM